jgi:hypothetical protein
MAKRKNSQSKSRQITVFVAEDHPIARKGIQEAIEKT